MRFEETLAGNYSYVYGGPVAHATIRRDPEDFQVEEELGFEPSGSGQHLLLQIRKRSTNTDYCARRLADYCQVSLRDVGYAGLKDRHAVTSQWFSIDLKGKTAPDWQLFCEENIELLHVEAHNRKLKKGALSGNRFSIILRDISGDNGAIEQRLQQIASTGVANYFGEQRFGHSNIDMARKMLNNDIVVKNRHKKGIYLSTARALLFNHVLSNRVSDRSWNQPVNGDVMILAGRRATFRADQVDEAITQRLEAGEIHITGPLCGRGEQLIQEDAKTIEEPLLAPCTFWVKGLERAGVEHGRRPLRLSVENLHWQWLESDVLNLHFRLTSGSYATSVLREIVSYQQHHESMQRSSEKNNRKNL
ncbi:MAG: tRNA pseudouridine(13) synthase TruD [Gammaproteobacteria bacterium]|nr:tRNA pseudouridine(13) synthase TruD [Gammaproteobacteria bacterium]